MTSSPILVSRFALGQPEINSMTVQWSAGTAYALRNDCGDDRDIFPVLVAYDLSKAKLVRKARERAWEAETGCAIRREVELLAVAPRTADDVTPYCPAVLKVYVLDYPFH